MVRSEGRSQRSIGRLALPAVAAALLAGCVTAGAGPASFPSPAPATGTPGASGVFPDPGTSPAGAPRGPGTSLPDLPVSTFVPEPPSGVVPRPSPTLVTPGPVIGDTHPVFVHGLSASVRGSRLVARLDWVSGVPPCTVLAGVDVVRAGSTFSLTAREGSGRVDVACIEIAMEKATEVDLGPVAAGRYIVSATPGEAPAVTVVVP